MVLTNITLYIYHYLTYMQKHTINVDLLLIIKLTFLIKKYINIGDLLWSVKKQNEE